METLNVGQRIKYHPAQEAARFRFSVFERSVAQSFIADRLKTKKGFNEDYLQPGASGKHQPSDLDTQIPAKLKLLRCVSPLNEPNSSLMLREAARWFVSTTSTEFALLDDLKLQLAQKSPTRINKSKRINLKVRRNSYLI